MNKAETIIADSLLSHQISMFRFTASERKKVLALLSGLQKELKSKLLTELTDFGKARVNKLLKESGIVIKDYYDNIQEKLGLGDLAKYEAAAVSKTFAEIGLDISLPSESALKALVNGSLIEGAPSAEWWSRQSEDIAFKFASQVRQGVAMSETVQQIVIRVAGSERLGVPGIFPVARRNAYALVHASVQQVLNDSRLETFRANDDVIKGMRHLSTLDSHTSLVCIARSGAEWDMEGNPIKGDFPFESPPLHFNCRSVLVPVLRTYRELGIDIPEMATGTRASDLGEVPADMSFNQFLKRHDDVYVDNLLGPGRAELWRNGKITLQDLLDQNGRPLTLAQLRGKS